MLSLVAKPMGYLSIDIEKPAEVAELVRAMTGGLPNLVQDVCSAVLSLPSVQRTRRFGIPEVKQAFEAAELTKGLEAHVSQIADDRDRYLMFSIAKMSSSDTPESFAVSELMELVRQDIPELLYRDIDLACESLEIQGILQRVGRSEYMVTCDALFGAIWQASEHEFSKPGREAMIDAIRLSFA